MSFEPRPCPHCAGTSFHVIPEVQFEMWRALRGGSMPITSRQWTFTFVACAQCGRTDTFTSDPAGLAGQYPGAQLITTTRPG